MPQRLLPRHLIRNGIPPIPIQPLHDQLGLLPREESVLIGEIDDGEDGDDSEQHGDRSENDKDPSPGVDLACSGDVDQAVSEDLGETGEHH
jgi:hypothetical protein